MLDFHSKIWKINEDIAAQCIYLFEKLECNNIRNSFRDFYKFLYRIPSDIISDKFRMLFSHVIVNGIFTGSIVIITEQAVVKYTFVHYIMLIEMEFGNKEFTTLIAFEVFYAKMAVQMVLIIAWDIIFEWTILTFFEVIVMNT